MFSKQTLKSMAKAVVTKNSPFYIQWFITKNCNLKCKMCNIVQANRDQTMASEAELMKIAENLKKIGAGVILLSGGEPFLHPQLPKIIKALTSRGMNVRLQSNGLRTDPKIIKQSFEAGAKDFSVSLDSLVEENQDYINSVKGSWKKSIETIANFSKYASKHHAICGLGTVLSPYNYKEIPNIIRFATEIGWYVSLVPVHITNDNSKKFFFRGTDKSFCFKKSQWPELDQLVADLKQMKKNGYNLFDSDDYLESSIDFIKTGHPTWRKYNKGVCDSPNMYFIILPSGQFAICADHRYPEKISVADPNFPKIFCSKEFRQKVRKTTTKCPGCQYGSYPEMSLSARSFSAMKGRLALMRKTKKLRVKSYSAAKMFQIIEKILKENPIEKNNY